MVYGDAVGAIRQRSDHDGDGHGTIQNDDTGLGIAAASANKAEGNTSGSTAFTFTVTRSGVTSGSTTVDWAVTGSGANPANGADFVGGPLPSGHVSFSAGETEQTITVNVNGDTNVESNEGFTVTLSGASGGAQVTTATATARFRTTTSRWSIAALSANKAEGNTATVRAPRLRSR